MFILLGHLNLHGLVEAVEIGDPRGLDLSLLDLAEDFGTLGERSAPVGYALLSWPDPTL